MTKNLRLVDKQVLIALLIWSAKDKGSGVAFGDIYGKVTARPGSKSTIYATLREFHRRGWVSIDERWTGGDGAGSPPERSWEYHLLARGRRIVERLVKEEWSTSLEAKQMGYRPQPAEGDAQSTPSD